MAGETQVGLGVRVYANVDELKKALKDGTAEVATTTAAMEKLSKSFSGDKLIQSANNVTAAVLNIGGASKLTEAEQARVNATLDKAIQKYELMGKTAPQAMRDLYDATKKIPEPANAANAALDKMWSGMKSAAGLVGVTFSVGAVVNFTAKVFDSASAIHDQAIALGFSYEGFQRNKYAVEQSGGSVEGFTRAVNKLNDNLANGNDSTVAALKAAGLQFDAIRAMKPEDAWAAVASAVGKIEDPMQRAQVAQDLFGKGALELLPGMIEGYEKLRDAATVMSNKTVERLEAAQDAWEAFGNKVITITGEALAAIMDTDNKGAGAMTALVAGYAGTTGAAIASAEAHRQAAAGLKDVHLAAEPLAKTVLPQTTEAAKRAEEAQKKAAEAAKRHAEEIGKLADTFTGKALYAKLRDIDEALLLTEGHGGLTVQQMARLAKELRDLEAQGARLTPRQQELIKQWRDMDITQRVAVDTTRLLTKSLDDQTRVLGYIPVLTADVKTHVVDFLNTVEQQSPKIEKLAVPPKVVDAWKDFKKDASNVLDSILSNTADSVVSLIGHWDRWKTVSLQIWDDIKSGISRILGDLLYEFEHRFIKGLIASITGAKGGFTGAFSNMFSQSIASASGPASTAATSTGTMAGSAWATAFTSVATTVLAAWGFYEAFSALGRWLGGGPSPERQTGISQDEYDRRYGSAEGNYNPDYGTGSVAVAPPQTGSPGDMYVPTDGLTPYQEYLRQREIIAGRSPGFAEGTGGQYLDFGRGTLAVLHGKERVMTEDEAAAGSGLTVNVYVTSPVTGGDEMRQIVYDRIVPILKDAWANNIRGSRTQARQALGVA